MNPIFTLLLACIAMKTVNKPHKKRQKFRLNGIMEMDPQTVLRKQLMQQHDTEKSKSYYDNKNITLTLSEDGPVPDDPHLLQKMKTAVVRLIRVVPPQNYNAQPVHAFYLLALLRFSTPFVLMSPFFFVAKLYGVVAYEYEERRTFTEIVNQLHWASCGVVTWLVAIMLMNGVLNYYGVPESEHELIYERSWKLSLSIHWYSVIGTLRWLYEYQVGDLEDASPKFHLMDAILKFIAFTCELVSSFVSIMYLGLLGNHLAHLLDVNFLSLKVPKNLDEDEE